MNKAHVERVLRNEGEQEHECWLWKPRPEETSLRALCRRRTIKHRSGRRECVTEKRTRESESERMRRERRESDSLKENQFFFPSWLDPKPKKFPYDPNNYFLATEPGLDSHLTLVHAD